MDTAELERIVNLMDERGMQPESLVVYKAVQTINELTAMVGGLQHQTDIAHSYLDRLQAPRHAPNGAEYSIKGRIYEYLPAHDNAIRAEVAEECISAITPIGYESRHAILTDKMIEAIRNMVARKYKEEG